MSFRNRLYGDKMALEHISEILKKLTEELKLDNDKAEERDNGRTNVLSTSNAGATRNRNETTGDNK
jgi:hypothetical protein